MILPFYYFVLSTSILLIPVLLSWIIADKFRLKIKILKNLKYLILAETVFILTVVILSYVSDDITLSYGYSNIILHFFGGGVMGSLIYIFFVKTLNLDNLAISYLGLLIFFFFISGLGVANEIFEFMIDMFVFRFVELSSDSSKDLVVNTAGGYTGLLLFYSIEALFKILTSKSK